MKKLLLPFFFLGTLAMMVVMLKTGATLTTDATPLGIMDLEFAYNTTKTSAVLNAWAPTAQTDNIAVARINTYWDFLFMVFYGGFLFLACKKMARSLKDPVAKAGNLIAKAVILALIFDLIENSGMLLTLNNYSSPAIAFCTTFFSVIKWGLVIIAVLYLLTGLLVLAYRKLVNS
jgi:hypothetical protein